MAVNFPTSPYIGEIFSYGGFSWQWNGTFWESYYPPSSGLTGVTSVGFGDSVIGGINNNVLELKSFSGDNITIIDDGDTLTFSAGTSPIGGVTTLTAGSGLSGDTTTGAVTLINTEPDQIVSLSGGTSMSVTGTYPNFTISYTGASGGGVTTLTAGSGLSGDTTTGAVTLINTEPDQTVTITGGTNIQITGTYPDFGVNFTGTTGSNFTGGTVSGATNFTGGLTANTVSATTYNNLPVSAVTNGTGISASTSNGVVTITNTEPDKTVTISGGTGITTGGTYPNFTITNSAPNQTVTINGDFNIDVSGTYPTFDINFTKKLLIATSTCQIVPDGTIYVGSTRGWPYWTWDLVYSDPIPFNEINCGIVLPNDLENREFIKVCGIAYTDSTIPDGEQLDVRLYYFTCDDFRTTQLSAGTFSYVKTDGYCCFDLDVDLPSNLVGCTTFLYLGFKSTNNSLDATIAKISWAITSHQ